MPTYINEGTNTFIMINASGNTVSVGPGDTIETYKILDTPFTKTLETPYFKLVGLSEDFVSPGTKTGLLDFKIIRLTADGDITVKANHTDNPYVLSLIDGVAMDVENSGEIESLVFAGTGTVKIEGF